MAIKERDYNVQTLRGIAIILVVAGHVIGSKANGGMKIDYPSVFRYFYLYIDYIQMPLFTALAGFVYGMKSSQDIDLSKFVKNKISRLLVPLVFVSSLYYSMQALMPGTNANNQLSDIWRIYIFPYSVYWYIASLFIIFIFVSLLDSRRLCDTINKWKVWVIVSVVAMMLFKGIDILEQSPNIFSYKGFINQLSYFLIGLGIKRFVIHLNKPQRIGCVIATITAVLLINYSWIIYDIYNKYIDIIGAVLVISTLFLLCELQIKVNIFMEIGNYSYTIYLYHIFFTGGVRIVLVKLGLDSNIIVFIITLVISLTGSICIDKLLSKWRITRKLLIGK